MKKIVCLGLLFGFMLSASAQISNKKKKQVQKKTVVKKTAAQQNSATVVLTTTTANAGYRSPSTSLKITDPTISAFNQKAQGTPVHISSSGIAGMPKGTYGFANGKIWLRTTTATSPGTGYGSGAVATGTAIQGIGTSEASIGVNGKNPYAGSGLWGNGQPVQSPPIQPVKAVKE